MPRCRTRSLASTAGEEATLGGVVSEKIRSSTAGVAELEERCGARRRCGGRERLGWWGRRTRDSCALAGEEGLLAAAVAWSPSRAPSRRRGAPPLTRSPRPPEKKVVRVGVVPWAARAPSRRRGAPPLARPPRQVEALFAGELTTGTVRTYRSERSAPYRGRDVVDP